MLCCKFSCLSRILQTNNFLSVFTETKLMSKKKENRERKIVARVHAAILSPRFIYGFARRSRRKRDL